MKIRRILLTFCINGQKNKIVSLYTDVPIEPGNTLIIFDEIQMSKGAHIEFLMYQNPDFR